MRTTLSTALLAALVVCLGCGTKKEESKEAPPPPPSTSEAFVPSADSSVTVTQMKRWLHCSAQLDSLSYIYRDSFAVQDPARLTVYQRDFIEAQNKLCIAAGLAGGYEEYLWVLRNAGLPRNKHILDSCGVGTH